MFVSIHCKLEKMQQFVGFLPFPFQFPYVLQQVSFLHGRGGLDSFRVTGGASRAWFWMGGSICSRVIPCRAVCSLTDKAKLFTKTAAPVMFSFPSLLSHPCCFLETPAGPPSLSSLDSPHPWDTSSSLSLHSSPDSPKHQTPLDPWIFPRSPLDLLFIPRTPISGSFLDSLLLLLLSHLRLHTFASQSPCIPLSPFHL